MKENEDEEKSYDKTEGTYTKAATPPLYHSPPHAPFLPPPFSSVQSPSPHQITKPHRIILVRHGESTGNADERVYVQTPDWKVGRERGRAGDGGRAGGKER